jgi:hypothetical protein
MNQKVFTYNIGPHYSQGETIQATMYGLTMATGKN